MRLPESDRARLSADPAAARAPRAIACSLAAIAAALVLGGCNRSADSGPDHRTTSASTGSAGSRGTTGADSASAPTGLSGTADRTGANAPSGSVGSIGTSGGVPATRAEAASGVAAGIGGTGSSGGGSPTADSSSTPGTTGTFGITANGLPRTSDDRRSASGAAAHSAAASAAPDDQLSKADKKFIANAGLSGLFEIQASQLAVARAAASEVKSYATMLVNDHTAASGELAQIATARGVPLPVQLPQDLQARQRKLSQQSSTAFDRDYVSEVGIKAHEKDVRDFEAASRDTKDPQLKAWIDKTLPSLQQHLAAARTLVERAKASR